MPSPCIADVHYSEQIRDYLPQLGPSRQLSVGESAAEVHLLLNALTRGLVPRPGEAPHTLAEYLSLLRLYERYRVRPLYRSMLVARAEDKAFDLVYPLSGAKGQTLTRDEMYRFFRLAHETRSAKLWETALRYAGNWSPHANPWRLGAEDYTELGAGTFDVLLALEALNSTFGDGIASLRVVYPDGEDSTSATLTLAQMVVPPSCAQRIPRRSTMSRCGAERRLQPSPQIAASSSQHQGTDQTD